MALHFILITPCLLVLSSDNLCKHLDPDQARQNVGPNLDPNCLTLMIFSKEYFAEVDFEKKPAEDNKSMKH